MKINIRQETPNDYPMVAKVVETAFRNDPFGDHTEHLLVARLRKSAAFIPELSLVAEQESKIVGHVLLTKIKIINDKASSDSLALAPVSVSPEYQRQGIGSQLIRAAHQKAKELGFKSIVLLGHADYYPRFGYVKAGRFGITLPYAVPDENCMAIELVENALANVSGVVDYPPPFFE